jgi:hypothetical protein
MEGLEAFRASLIIYLSKARPTLEEVSADVVRTRVWLQNDQRLFWENQVRRRHKELDQAQQALFSAGVSILRTASDTEKMAVHRAKRALEEAEAKLKLVKQWSREYDSRTDPLTKQLDKLHTLLCHDMQQAVASLTQTVKALEAYAEVAAPSASDEPGPPTAAAAEAAPGAAESSGPPPTDPAGVSQGGHP